jgi:predicted ATPase
LIQAVSPIDEASLQQALARLVEAEVLYQRGQPPQARYLFKHALIQDAAYQSLLKSARQQYHRQIAQILEERFTEITETQPELLAYHYTEAGLSAQAIPYWQKAGQKAVGRSANVEAINHLTKGLELLKTLPDTPERAQHEIMLQIALGVPLTATKGWAAPEVEKVYVRARELCQQVGETSQLFPTLWGLWQFYVTRPEYKAAHELAEELLSLAQTVQDSAFLLEAHFTVGFTLSFLGEIAPARVHLEQSIALYDPQQHCSHAFLYGQDPRVTCLSFAACALWWLGYPDQALQKSREALTLAQGLSHPHSLAFALGFAAAWLHQYRHEVPLTYEWAEATFRLSTEQGFAFWINWGTILRGWALVEQGQGQEGIVQIRQGLDTFWSMREEFAQTYYLALLAEAYGIVGQAKEGLIALAEALAAVDNTGERFYEAELYRLKGQLTLQKFQVSGSRFQVKDSSESGVRSQKQKSVSSRPSRSLAARVRSHGSCEQR